MKKKRDSATSDETTIENLTEIDKIEPDSETGQSELLTESLKDTKKEEVRLECDSEARSNELLAETSKDSKKEIESLEADSETRPNELLTETLKDMNKEIERGTVCKGLKGIKFIGSIDCKPVSLEDSLLKDAKETEETEMNNSRKPDQRVVNEGTMGNNQMAQGRNYSCFNEVCTDSKSNNDCSHLNCNITNIRGHGTSSGTSNLCEDQDDNNSQDTSLSDTNGNIMDTENAQDNFSSVQNPQLYVVQTSSVFVKPYANGVKHSDYTSLPHSHKGALPYSLKLPDKDVDFSNELKNGNLVSPAKTNSLFDTNLPNGDVSQNGIQKLGSSCVSIANENSRLPFSTELDFLSRVKTAKPVPTKSSTYRCFEGGLNGDVLLEHATYEDVMDTSSGDLEDIMEDFEEIEAALAREDADLEELENRLRKKQKVEKGELVSQNVLFLHLQI